MPHNITVQERFLSQIVAHYDMEKPIWSVVRYMTPADFTSPTSIHPLLIILADNIRWRATQLAGRDVKVIVTSDHRPDDEGSSHGEKLALGLDIRAKSSRDRYYLHKATFELGITRIGVYCDDDHLHVDIADYFFPDKYDAQVEWVRECPDV